MIEQVVIVPVINPATGGRSRTFRYAAKPDRVDIEAQLLVDWKTGSTASEALTRARRTMQAPLYALALRDIGCYVSEVEFRAITRPDWKYQKRGVGDETLEDYSDRMLTTLVSDPFHLMSDRVVLDDDTVFDARGFLWDVTSQIRACRREVNWWLPNANACFRFNRPCPYREVCNLLDSGRDWEAYFRSASDLSENRNPELGDEGLDDRVITHTAVSTFCDCQRKYWFRWELRRRMKSESGENRNAWFGSLVHAGLAVAPEDQDMLQAIQEESLRDCPYVDFDAQERREIDVARAFAAARAARDKWLCGTS